MIRNYTDAHPNEPCAGCPFCVIQHAKCTYKSKKYYCYRDEIWDKENNADHDPQLFEDF